MLKALIPDLYLESIHDLDPERLRRRGIKAVLVDLDNTLTQWRYGQPDATLAAWVQRLRDSGIEPFIVSNNRRHRVQAFVEALRIDGLADAVKPRRAGYRKAMRALKIDDPAQVAVLGDQLFTDILGGNRLGAMTILVRPVSQREMLWTRFVRILERAVMRRLLRDGLLQGPQRLTDNP